MTQRQRLASIILHLNYGHGCWRTAVRQARQVALGSTCPLNLAAADAVRSSLSAADAAISQISGAELVAA